MTVAPGDDRPASTAAVRRPMFCKGCQYDLAHSADLARADGKPVCPECGRAFDPARPRSTHRKPGGTVLAFLLTRALPSLVVSLVIVWLVLWGWIPLPAPIAPAPRDSGWTLWHWRGEWYGWEERSIAMAGNRLAPVRVYLWSTNVRGVSRDRVLTNAEGAEVGRERLWTVRRDGDRWSVQARAGTGWGEVLQAWNLTRDGNRFGLYMTSTPTPTTADVAIDGAEADVLTAMANAWRVQLTPGVRSPGVAADYWRGDTLQWVWDPFEGRIARVPSAVAFVYAGFDPRDFRHPRHPQNRFQSPEPGWFERHRERVTTLHAE